MTKKPQRTIRQRAVGRRLTGRPAAAKPAREDFFAAAVRMSPHPIGITELKTGRCLEINDACLDIYGFRREEVIGKTTLMLGIWPDPHDRARFIDRLKAKGSVRNFEIAMRMKSGVLRQFLISTDLITVGTTRCLLTVGTDITERKRTEEVLKAAHEELEHRVRERTRDLQLANAALQQQQQELQRYHMQLEDLTAKLLAAQDHERHRIARELHDDFSQRLAAVVLDVAALETASHDRPGSGRQALEEVRRQLEGLSDDVHTLAYRLHPSLLEDVGLEAAVQDHLQQVRKRSGLRISLLARDIPSSLSLDRSTGLFRVLQESLQNILKHAAAAEVKVKLIGSSQGIGLSVADDGRGFDVQDTTVHQRGLGLVSMQERLRQLNGFLRFQSQPGTGTRISAWIPFQQSVS